jgi:hypothetical protein
MRHELSLVLLLEEGPCPPLYSLEGQSYMEVLVGYELRSPTRVLTFWVLSYILRLVLLLYE